MTGPAPATARNLAAPLDVGAAGSGEGGFAGFARGTGRVLYPVYECSLVCDTDLGLRKVKPIRIGSGQLGDRMNASKREPTAKRGLGSCYGVATGLTLCCLSLLAAGAGPAAAQAVLPPVLSVAFTPSQVLVGDRTTLTVTVTNPNQTPVEGILNNITFSDTYPAGLVPDEPIISNSVGGTCGSDAATAGFNTPNFTPTGFNLVEANDLAAGESCTVVVLMHATSAGRFVDTTSTIFSPAATGLGAAASATLTATVPVPSLGSWSLIGFGLLLGTAFYRAARRRAA